MADKWDVSKTVTVQKYEDLKDFPYIEYQIMGRDPTKEIVGVLLAILSHYRADFKGIPEDFAVA